MSVGTGDVAGGIRSAPRSPSTPYGTSRAQPDTTVAYGGVRWRHGHARCAMSWGGSRSRAPRRLVDPLFESIHDVALLTRAAGQAPGPR